MNKYINVEKFSNYEVPHMIKMLIHIIAMQSDHASTMSKIIKFKFELKYCENLYKKLIPFIKRNIYLKNIKIHTDMLLILHLI